MTWVDAQRILKITNGYINAHICDTFSITKGSWTIIGNLVF